MNKAMTFTPGISIGADGQEHYDVENGTLTSRSGFQSEDVVSYNEATGETNILITEEDLQQDADYTPDITEEYLSSVLEAYPNLEEAQNWAFNNWTDQQVEDFNKAVNTGEPSEMMPKIEQLMEEFYNAEPEVASVEEEPTNEITAEAIVEAYDTLNQQEPEGLESAYEWMNAASQAKDAGDEVMADVLSLTAEFHRGNITAEEAFQQALERHPTDKLAAVYQQMMY